MLARGLVCATLTTADLPRSGRFYEAALGRLKTDDGVFRTNAGFLGAWVRDPDGNILGIEGQRTRA